MLDSGQNIKEQWIWHDNTAALVTFLQIFTQFKENSR